MYISDVRSSLIITLQPHRWASETALVISWCLLGVKTSNRGVRRGTGFLSMLFLRKNYSTGEPNMSFLVFQCLQGPGNTAGAEILEGDVWRAPKSQHTGRATVGLLWGSEIPDIVVHF